MALPNLLNQREFSKFVEDSAGQVAVRVQSVAGGSAAPTSDASTQVDDAAFTPATSSVSMIGAEFDDTSPDSVNEGDGGAVRMSGNRNLYTQIRDAAGSERGVNVTTNNALQTESVFSYSRKTADGQVKATAGFVHAISIAPLTATPTAGLLTIYDDPAETGTVLYAEWIFATTVGHTIILDTSFANGLYVGFDGTLANVQVTVSYR